MWGFKGTVKVSLSRDTRDQYTTLLLAEVLVTEYPTVQTIRIIGIILTKFYLNFSRQEH